MPKGFLGGVLISTYRIYKYPLRGDKQYRHISFKRDLRVALARRSTHKILDKLEHDAKLDESLMRSRRTIRDLILCNPFDYFCTFTFSPEKIDRYDYTACQKRLAELFKNYKQRYAYNFRYILVPEQHKDGAWHFHGMVSGIRPEHFTVPELIWVHPFKNRDELIQVPNKHGYVDWSYYSKKLGFFNCSQIKNYSKCAEYVAKYVTKGLSAVTKGKQVVLASKNLHRPELVFDCDGVPCDFTPEYEDDFVRISWQSEQYTLDRGYITPWSFDCCSELGDDLSIYEDEESNEIFAPLTGQQLRL